MKKKCIAIIPAKGKSTRLPNKNIKLFLRQPIIGVTIRTLKKSGIFDKIIVSTDSKKVADIAKKCGAEVPFLRPKKYAHKVISTRPSINHCINYLIHKNFKFDYVCEVYAANPFLRISDLKEGRKKIMRQKNCFVFSATNYLFPYYRSFLLKNGKLKPVFKSNINKGSQNLEKIMCDAAQFYWAHKNTWRNNKNSIFSPKSKIIEIPNFRYHDIDTLEDWARAELFYKILEKKKK